MQTYTFKHCLDTGMQNDDNFLLSISLASHGQIVNMLMNLKPHIVKFLSSSLLVCKYKFAATINREGEESRTSR